MTIDSQKGLELLGRIIRTSNSTLNIDERLQKILEDIYSPLMSNGSAIYVFNAEENSLHLKISKNRAFNDILEIADSFLEASIKDGYHILSDDPEVRAFLVNDPADAFSETAGVFPIMDERFFYGILVLTFAKGDTPDANDLKIIVPITHEIAGTMRNARLYSKAREMVDELTVINREKELMVNEMASLFEMNKAVMTTIDLDRLLHIVLTAVTTGAGFGFNRAMLFLYNDKTEYLQGMMAVGPDSADEAFRIWSEISEKKKTFHDILTGEGLTKPESMLNKMVKEIRISMDEGSILGLTVREKKAFNIKDAWNDPGVNKGLLGTLGCNAFATAPLMASGRVVGVILVDNIFNARSITDDDIRLLTIFSNQAGMAIENSILFRNLQDANLDLKETQSKLFHSEKLIALGEMAAGVAHEIRNPLVSIGGFARRLARRIEDSESVKYAGIICREVERLENILNEILLFSREEPPDLDLLNINGVIEDTLQFFWNDFQNSNIEVYRDLKDGPDMIDANYHQLKQVFINLFSNAKHTMEKGGTLTIRSSLDDHEDIRYINVEISDTGGGIPYSIMSNIFNPFFTTKGGGTGLGLTITHRIITNFGGDIEVSNNKSGGATFIIKIPVSTRKH